MARTFLIEHYVNCANPDCEDVIEPGDKAATVPEYGRAPICMDCLCWVEERRVPKLHEGYGQ